MNSGNSPIQNQLTAWLLRRTATTGFRRVASLAAAIASEVGSVREENQDRAVIMRGRDKRGKDYALVAVADGIGGMRDGATCAAITISAFLTSVYQHAQTGTDRSKDWLQISVHAANHAVLSRFRGNGGSTLVALLVRPDHAACWLSVGDSRVYRSTGKKLTQLSVDDTIAGQLGNITEAAFEQSKLLQFIGMEDGLEPHIAVFDDEPADAVVLTTDGVHYLAHAPGWLGQIVGNAPDPGACVKRLVEVAKWCGGPDNATVAMIYLSTDREPDGSPPYPCLEVWDAFGELQIITSEAVCEELSLARHHQNSLSVQPSAAVTDVVTPVSASPPPLKPERKISTRRTKGVNKAKSSTVKRDAAVAKSPKTKSAQLLMEFPNKPN